MQFAGSFFDQKLYFRKTNNSASTDWSRLVNSTDANNTSGYLMFDVAAWNGVEGNTWVEIINGQLTIRGCTEGCAYASATIRYTLNNVASAKVVMLITNDDTGGSGNQISGWRQVSVTNGGGNQYINTDLGKSGSDGNVQTVYVVFNPL